MLTLVLAGALTLGRPAAADGQIPPGLQAIVDRNPVDVRTLIGRRLWARIVDFLKPCAAVSCPGSQIGQIVEPGTSFVIVDVVVNRYDQFFVKAQLPDGSTGFMLPSFWNSEDPHAAAQRTIDELHARWQREDDERRRQEQEAEAAAVRACRGFVPVAIGMTERQVYDKSWGEPYTVNRTITAPRRARPMGLPVRATVQGRRHAQPLWRPRVSVFRRRRAGRHSALTRR
jgi:hypothetical protein